MTRKRVYALFFLGYVKKKHTVDEGVQDGHGTSGDTSVRVDLLEDWKWSQ